MSNLAVVRKRLREIYGESCVNTVTKADIKEANQLKTDAEKGVSFAVPYAQNLAKDLGLSGSAVQVGPMKTMTRMFEKAIGKLDGHLDEIGDVGRLRVLVEGPEDIKELRRIFSAGRNNKFAPFHPDNRVTVTGVQDYYLEPSKTGRIAYHVDLDVTISGGKSVGIEIQFIDKRMLATEKATHANYQKACSIERAAKREGRELTHHEEKAIKSYRESNEKMYLADALNYGYYDLRRPDLRAKDVQQHLRLIA